LRDGAATGACGGGAAALDSGLVAAATQHWDPLAAAGAVPPAPPALHTHFRWNVTIMDAANGAQASAAAVFVSGVVASPADWLGAEWLASDDAIRERARLASTAPGGEWRCRAQSDVALCSTMRELDAAALALGPAAAANVASGNYFFVAAAE
jgi:hypothetical protein